MSQPQKKLKFNKSNFFTGIFLLTLVNLVGPAFVDPKLEAGKVFYFVVAVFTALMFPFLEVVDDESQS
jgi:hypothetical protein